MPGPVGCRVDGGAVLSPVGALSRRPVCVSHRGAVHPVDEGRGVESYPCVLVYPVGVLQLCVDECVDLFGLYNSEVSAIVLTFSFSHPEVPVSGGK